MFMQQTPVSQGFAEACTSRGAENRGDRARIAEQALSDDTPHRQCCTSEKRCGKSIAAQLQKRIAELRVGEVARSDEHGEHSGDEQQQKQQRIQPHGASLPRVPSSIDALGAPLTV